MLPIITPLNLPVEFGNTLYTNKLFVLLYDCAYNNTLVKVGQQRSWTRAYGHLCFTKSLLCGIEFLHVLSWCKSRKYLLRYRSRHLIVAHDFKVRYQPMFQYYIRVAQMKRGQAE
ncbi:hypothetical protein TNCV_4137211 [Trichonephila clavipes]|nr:hypothetical protein TNCV_4137211 [Trichonephila clavipes]